MSDKQTTSVLLLVIVSFVFWLYNKNKLQDVFKAINTEPNTTTISTNKTNTVTVPGSLPPIVNTATTNNGITVLAAGRYANPYNTGLTASGTLNAYPVFDSGIISYV